MIAYSFVQLISQRPEYRSIVSKDVGIRIHVLDDFRAIGHREKTFDVFVEPRFVPVLVSKLRSSLFYMKPCEIHERDRERLRTKR